MLAANSHKNNSNKIKPQNTIARIFQKQIANAFTLYLNYKHYHWQSRGPMTRDLHIIFDEFANDVYETVEELSERVRKTAKDRVRVKEFSLNASIRPSKEASDVRRMIEEAYSNTLLVIWEIREIINKTPGLDMESAKVFERFLKMYEKHQWWLRYILDKRQGLTNN